MPWTAKDAARHNKEAVGRKASAWAKIANKVLAESGDEGKAIRIANAAIKKVHPEAKKELSR